MSDIMLFFPLLFTGEGPRVRVIPLIPDSSLIQGRRELITNTSMIFFIISKVSINKYKGTHCRPISCNQFLSKTENGMLRQTE